MVVKIDTPAARKCAFCRFWNDPTNSAITPTAPQVGLWTYENLAEKKCLKCGLNKPAFANCCDFQSKMR